MIDININININLDLMIVYLFIYELWRNSILCADIFDKQVDSVGKEIWECCGYYAFGINGCFPVF